MTKPHRYDVNVYKNYSNYYYKCKSVNQRNALLTWMAKYGVNVPKGFISASEAWRYLVINKEFEKIAMQVHLNRKTKYSPNHTFCDLKRFINLFNFSKKFFNIYGEKRDMIKIIDKDLFDGHDDIIIHQCNCYRNWGAGIAIPMKAHYPKAYQADLNTEFGNKEKLGTYTSWTGKSIHKDKQITVINAYGQFGCGVDRQRTTYEALKKALTKVNEDFPEGTIGMPKIGCGLGGGDWNTVLKIIEEAFSNRQVTIYEPARYKKC